MFIQLSIMSYVFSMLVKRSSENIFKAYIIPHGMYAHQGWFLSRRMTLDGRFKMQKRLMSKENAKQMQKLKEMFAIYKIVKCVY